MKTICGADCSNCGMQESCAGCVETNGRPLGGECVAAVCYKSGGEKCFLACKQQIIEEFLPYTLSNGQTIKLLDDRKIYLGYQVEKKDSGRCYGLVADREYLLVCEYGCNGEDPEIILLKKRN